jgi:hypothetical protein
VHNHLHGIGKKTEIAYFIDYQLIIDRDIFISSKFDMYCGGCGSIPFWRWLKRNQQFSLSVTCNDYGQTNGEFKRDHNYACEAI